MFYRTATLPLLSKEIEPALHHFNCTVRLLAGVVVGDNRVDEVVRPDLPAPASVTELIAFQAILFARVKSSQDFADHRRQDFMRGLPLASRLRWRQ